MYRERDVYVYTKLVYTCLSIPMYIYIYIYLERERGIEIYRDIYSLVVSCITRRRPAGGRRAPAGPCSEIDHDNNSNHSIITIMVIIVII